MQIGFRPFCAIVWVFFGRTKPNQKWEIESGMYTIQPNSGCMLAIMAITETLLNPIQHVYWEEAAPSPPLLICYAPSLAKSGLAVSGSVINQNRPQGIIYC